MHELFPHQIEAVNQLRTGSILCGGVGSGKSRTAIDYFYNKVLGGKPPFKQKTLLIITTARKRNDLDWLSESSLYGIYPDGGWPEITMIVDSWNNIHKYIDIQNAMNRGGYFYETPPYMVMKRPCSGTKVSRVRS